MLSLLTCQLPFQKISCTGFLTSQFLMSSSESISWRLEGSQIMLGLVRTLCTNEAILFKTGVT